MKSQGWRKLLGALLYWIRSNGWGVTIVASILTLILFGGAQSAHAGYASILVDANSGEVLNDVNADQINHPASLTKMMTLYLAFEALGQGKLQWDTPLHVSSWSANKSPTKLGLQPGSTITVHDCILGMIVLSANDAATVMAEALGGTEANFGHIMTGKAHSLGMDSTNFVNASGLPDEHQTTTAHDLIRLALALHKDYPEQYHLFSSRDFVFHGRMIAGHNRLMYRYAGMDGLKTGYTGASGFNLASSAERDGRRLVGVVMGSQSAPVRDQLMATLLDNGFAHRPTSAVLVAEAAGQSSHAARRIFAGAESVVAALSPVQKAEAATLPSGGMPKHHSNYSSRAKGSTGSGAANRPTRRACRVAGKRTRSCNAS